MDETRRHIKEIYDFEEKSIFVESAFSGGWHTSGTMQVVRLAFNLYNGFHGFGYHEKEIDDPKNFTPYELFYNCNLREYFFVEVELRFSL